MGYRNDTLRLDNLELFLVSTSFLINLIYNLIDYLFKPYYHLMKPL